jgi:hypothetical protein
MSTFTAKLSAFFLGRAKLRAPDVVDQTQAVIMMVSGIGCPICDDVAGGCSNCDGTPTAPRTCAVGTINPPIRER